MIMSANDIAKLWYALPTCACNAFVDILHFFHHLVSIYEILLSPNLSCDIGVVVQLGLILDHQHSTVPARKKPARRNDTRLGYLHFHFKPEMQYQLMISLCIWRLRCFLAAS
jgi:hypothetical protein